VSVVSWKNIVVGIDLAGTGRSVSGADDLSPACRTALDAAVWLSRTFDSSLHVLAALDVDARSEGLILDARRSGRDCAIDRAARVLDSLVETRRGQDVRVSIGVTFGYPGVVLLDDVRRNDRDLVVVGSGGNGARDGGSVGGTILHLLRYCPIPVWVARRTPAHGVRTVVAATTLDEPSPEVVRSAASLARACAAELHLLHVADDSAERVLRAIDADESALGLYLRGRRSDADAATSRLIAEAATIGCNVTTRLSEGRPARVIVEGARRAGADVVVLGASPPRDRAATARRHTAEQVLAGIDSSLLAVPLFPAVT